MAIALMVARATILCTTLAQMIGPFDGPPPA